MAMEGPKKIGHSGVARGAAVKRFTPEQAWRTNLAKRVYGAFFRNLKGYGNALQHLTCAALLIRIGRKSEAEYHLKTALATKGWNILGREQQNIAHYLLEGGTPGEGTRTAAEEFVKKRVEIPNACGNPDRVNTAAALLREGKIEAAFGSAELISDYEPKKREILMAILQALHDVDSEVAVEGRYNSGPYDVVLRRQEESARLWFQMVLKREKLRAAQARAEAAARGAGDVSSLFDEANAIWKLSMLAAILHGVVEVKKMTAAARESGWEKTDAEIESAMGVDEGKREAAKSLLAAVRTEAEAPKDEGKAPQIPEILRRRFKKAAAVAHPDRGGDVRAFQGISSACADEDLTKLHLALAAVEAEPEYVGVTPEITADLDAKIKDAEEVPRAIADAKKNVAQKDALVASLQGDVDFLGRELFADVFMHIPTEHCGLARELFQRFGIRVPDPFSKLREIRGKVIIGLNFLNKNR